MAIEPKDRIGTAGSTISDPGNPMNTRINEPWSGGGAGSTAAGDGTHRLTSQAREKAGAAVQRATDKARSGFEDTKSRAANDLGSIAESLRRTGSELSTNEQSLLAPYISRAADQVERFSSFLNARSADRLVHDVENFARRNPVAFLGGCFVAGLAAARFFKASRPELPASYDDQERALEGAGYDISGYDTDMTRNR